ncbi:MAG: acyl-CoA dehydrogenase family protein, partial [Tepidimonas sp.]|nr:acyl-CoA dehydrogenase family protein [Tepidimonas sp.]
MSSQGLRSVIDFLLYDWLRVTTLCSRPRYAEHGRETFDAVLDTCERIAREKYAAYNRTVDTDEPRWDGERVIVPACTHEAWQAYAQSGMLAAAQDVELGGMQL